MVDTTEFSNRRIAQILSVAPNTVRFYRERFVRADLNWEQVQEMDDLELISKLHLRRKRSVDKVMPEWNHIYERLSKNKHLTLEIVHEEYRAIHKHRAYAYSQFTHYYRKFLKKIDVTLRLQRFPGEAMYVDFAGTLISWRCRESGKTKPAQVFVAVLGYSSYTFACAVASQKLRDFISAHIQAFEFYGGVPEGVVPDNLKAAVTTPGSDPILNRSYQDMAAYYDCAILPARVRKPRDKGIVEQAVRFVSRNITSRLLERTFFSIDEINEAIQELLKELNNRPMKNYEGSRESRFEQTEKEKLRALPAFPYQFSEWVPSQKVPSDYHAKVFDHWYSVPYTLVGERIDARASKNSVEIFHNNNRVAIHPRQTEVGGFTTDKSHMPPQHATYSEQGLKEYIEWASSYGPATMEVFKVQYQGKRDNSMVANKACSSLKSLAKTYDNKEFEAACARALSIASPTLKSIKSILRTGLYKFGSSEIPVQASLPLHQNVRGSSYYQMEGL